MDNWPNIPLPSACPSGIRDPLLEDEFQSGDDAARPQFAAPRCLPITLSWNWMHKTHLATLRTFQKAHRADLFLWEDPFTGEQWEARFAGEEPVKWSPIAKLPDYAQVTATIKPVNEVVLPADAPVTKCKPSYILSAEIGLSNEVVQRASEQTYRREDGSLGVMPANTLVPSVKNGRKCFEVYESRKNIAYEELTNAKWKKYGVNFSSLSSMLSVDGETMVPKLTENLGEFSHRIWRDDPIVGNEEYTLSVFLKRGERQYGRLRLGTDVGFVADVFFDLGEGIFPRSTDYQKGTIEEWRNGWCRVTLTAKLQAEATVLSSAGLYIWDTVNGGSGAGDGYLGNGVDGLYVDRFQIEKGRSASHHVSQNIANGVRPATEVTHSSGHFPASTQGTFVVEFEKTGVQDGRVVFALGKNDKGSLYVSMGVAYVNFINGGVGGVSKNVPNGTVRVAARYSPTSIAFSVNGDSINTAANNISLTGWEKLYIGKASWGNWNFLNSSIYSLIYYPEAVTDEELQAFSEVRHA